MAKKGLFFEMDDYSCVMARETVRAFASLVASKVAGASFHGPFWKDNAPERINSPDLAPLWTVWARAGLPLIGACIEIPEFSSAIWGSKLVGEVRSDSFSRIEKGGRDVFRDSPWGQKLVTIQASIVIAPQSDDFDFSLGSHNMSAKIVVWEWNANRAFMENMDMADELMTFSRQFLTRRKHPERSGIRKIC